uniref:Uncharacterized protein n=1 Tax=Arundo donax TaxID=35708 RepID=A0A0A9CHS0_ARUDO
MKALVTSPALVFSRLFYSILHRNRCLCYWCRCYVVIERSSSSLFE